MRILDGDVTIYGLFRQDKSKIAEIVKFSEDGNKTLLAEVRHKWFSDGLWLMPQQIEWLGDRKDRVRFEGGDWQRIDKAWDHYKITRDKEV